MLLKGLLFLSGVVICARLPLLPAFSFSLALPLVAGLGWRYRYFCYPACLICGFLWTLFSAHLLLQHELLPQDEGKTLYAEGLVASLPETNDRSARFNFRIENLYRNGQATESNPGKVRLSWYQGHQPVKPGERWRLKIRLKRPHGFMNPGGFDYEAWLFQNRLRATGYVVDSRDNVKLADANGFNLNAIRLVIKNKIQEIIDADSLAGFIPALAIGDRSGISDAQWRVLTATGTNHLIAISGLHIGLIASLAYLLVLKIWTWSLGPFVNVPASRIASAGAMFAALIYALLAGFSLPTQRALIMLCVYFSMKLYGRGIIPGDALGIAIIAVLIIDPFAPLSAGFWLSFTAVAVIIYGVSHRVHHQRHWWWQWGRVQYVVSLGLLPALAFYYQQIPVFSIFANMLAVPWVSFIVIPLILSGCGLLFIHSALAKLLLELSLLSLHGLWSVLDFFMLWQIHLIPVIQPEIMTMTLAAIGVLILLLPAGITARWLGLIWLMPLFFPIEQEPPFGDVAMTVLDVGQGLSIVVQTENHSLLYDVGPGYASGFNTGEAVVLPFLRASGIASVDLLVQSHGDNDHIGGLKGIIDEIPIMGVISSVPERIPRGPVRDCHDGQSWQWDGVRFDVLHPAIDTSLSGNNRSCVLRISARNLTLLLTGDIEKSAERRLIKRHDNRLKSNILIAPHHGSRTSSTRGFIEAVSPDIVIFPVGYRNRFKLPNQDIITRYKSHKAKMLTTAKSGAIRVTIKGTEIEVMEHRKKNRRFWHTASL